MQKISISTTKAGARQIARLARSVHRIEARVRSFARDVKILEFFKETLNISAILFAYIAFKKLFLVISYHTSS